MKINPRLVHESITAFGSTGPKSTWVASDLTLWAPGGLMSATRDNRARPLRFNIPQSYLHAAADGAGGALIAHFARLQTGCGQHVDISAQARITQSTVSMLVAPAIGHENYDFSPKPPPSKTAGKTVSKPLEDDGETRHRESAPIGPDPAERGPKRHALPRSCIRAMTWSALGDSNSSMRRRLQGRPPGRRMSPRRDRTSPLRSSGRTGTRQPVE